MNVKFSQTVLPLVIFLALFVREGLAIWCYECNTHGNDKCLTPEKYKDELKVDCGNGTAMCRKIEQYIEINGDEQVRVHRECGYSGNLGECLERTGTYKFKSWYCNCNNEDYCNSGSLASVSLIVTGAALSSVYLLRKLL